MVSFLVWNIWFVFRWFQWEVYISLVITLIQFGRFDWDCEYLPNLNGLARVSDLLCHYWSKFDVSILTFCVIYQSMRCINYIHNYMHNHMLANFLFNYSTLSLVCTHHLHHLHASNWAISCVMHKCLKRSEECQCPSDLPNKGFEWNHALVVCFPA